MPFPLSETLLRSAKSGLIEAEMLRRVMEQAQGDMMNAMRVSDTVMALSERRIPAQSATAVLERPTGTPWTLPPVMPDDEYLRVAAKIGLLSPAVLKARLDRFLAMRGWPVFEYEKVWAYLQQLAAKETERTVDKWGRSSYNVPVWKPLRAQDMGLQGEIYPHAVPLHAILKVEELESEFPKGLTFAVSDYEAVKPDPFLMVTAPGLPYYVIDVWDEPGFHA